jgi:hypothetical protein
LILRKIRLGKKGSMEMSINSIVILVMAMALLGIGLVFIRGMMGGATSKLGKSIDAADLSEQPTSEKPLTIDKTVSVKKGDNEMLKVGFYNTQNVPVNVKPCVTKCINSTGSSAFSGSIKIQAISQNTPTGKAIGYEGMMNANVNQDTYTCQIEMIASASTCSLNVAASGTTNMPTYTSTQFFLVVSS